jgi:hypothetical protein
MEFRKNDLAAYIQGTAFSFIPLKIRYKKEKMEPEYQRELQMQKDAGRDKKVH